MSRQELKRFRQDLRANSELKGKLKQAKKEATLEATCTFATAAGYTITLEDLKAPRRQKENDGKEKAKKNKANPKRTKQSQ